MLIPQGQTTSGQATVMISWYSNSPCAQLSFLSTVRTFEIRDPGSWLRTEEALTAPPGALGGRIQIGVFKTGTARALAVQFDEVSLAPEPTGTPSGLAALLVSGALRRQVRSRRAHAHPRDRRAGGHARDLANVA